MSDQNEDIEDVSEMSDEVQADVVRPAKGPDSSEWGDEEDRKQADVEAGKYTDADLVSEAIQAKLDAGEDPIVEIDGKTVKGPDPVKWSVPDDK